MERAANTDVSGVYRSVYVNMLFCPSLEGGGEKNK